MQQGKIPTLQINQPQTQPQPQPTPSKVEQPPKPTPSASVASLPVKGAKMPTKGQRGIQKTITDEEQKKLYLDKLSKMSVKRADTELSKIEKVLEEHKHDKKLMKTKEVVLKKQLKLINEAMLFGKEETEQPEAVEVEAEVEQEIKE